jgi:hypothetical membrane protein
LLLGSTACYIAVTVLFYGLFGPSTATSRLSALFSLLGCALSILGVFHADPIKLNPLVPFGFYCLLIGYLIVRSTFLPRILGVLMACGGLGWLTFISPTLFDLPVAVQHGAGEAALTVWLLAVGVNAERWKEQAMRAVAGQRALVVDASSR